MQLLNKIKEDEEEIACSQEFIGKTKNEAAKRFLYPLWIPSKPSLLHRPSPEMYGYGTHADPPQESALSFHFPFEIPPDICISSHVINAK